MHGPGQPSTAICAKAASIGAARRHFNARTAAFLALALALAACKDEPAVTEAVDAAPPADAAPPEAPRRVLAGPVPLEGAPPSPDVWWDAAAVSPDGVTIAAAYKDTLEPARGRLGLWGVDDGALVWLAAEAVWSEGCDFHPAGDRIYCAHQPRPDWSRTELLVFGAADGALLDRVVAPSPSPAPQVEPWWGDSARVSPDGRWVAMTQGVAEEGGGRVVVIAIGPDGGHDVVAALAVPSPDEVAFAADGSTLYASAFVDRAVYRFRWDGAAWRSDGRLDVGAAAAGLDVDGDGRVVGAGFWDERVVLIDPAPVWIESRVRSVPVEGVSYELCADPRPGAAQAFAVSQDGRAQALDTAAGVVIGRGRVDPADADGLAMTCHRATGRPFVISRGNLWTWIR